MKKTVLVFTFLLFILSTVNSQINYRDLYSRNKYPQSVSIQAGVAFNPDYSALKFNAEFYNLVFNYVGFYTSFEIGVGSSYWSNIIGFNVSFAKIIYAYAGMDLFTKQHGIIHNDFMGGVRKEIGMGFFPVKNLVLRIGFSLDVALTLTVGYRLPFDKMRSKRKIKLPAGK